MQEQIIVKPTYTGPRLIEVYLKKAKGHSSLGRMLSTSNKRFFVLDLNRLLFYYLPEREATLSNATEIPLDSISRIYVEHRAQLSAQDQASKGFVILTKKKAYKLLCDSQLVMEQILFAFSNLVGAQSQKPLYDWNSYFTADNQEGASMGTQNNQRSASKEPSTANKMEYQPAMHKRRGSNVNRSPVRVAYDSQNSQEQQQKPHSPAEKETIIKSQPKRVNIVEEMSLPKVQSSQTIKNSEPEQPIQEQQIPQKNDKEESRTVEVERSSSPLQHEKERRSASKENQRAEQVRGRNMGPNLNIVQVQNSDHMVEIQSLDLPSKPNSDEAKNVPALSSRQLQSFRRSSASRQKAVNVPVGRIQNINSVPLQVEQDSLPNKLPKVSENPIETTKVIRNEEVRKDMSKSDPNSSTLSRKPYHRGAEDYGFSPKDAHTEERRAEEVLDSNMPLSYLDIMKLKKKDKSNPQFSALSESNTPSSKYEVQRQVNIDNDDWDNEMFGDGKLSPVRVQKKLDNTTSNYNSQYISQPNQSSTQIPKLTAFNERKVEAKTETFVVRGHVHNDWDDDL